MPEWCATRPVDVARLNSGVFRAVIRKYEILLALAAPAYLVGAVLLAVGETEGGDERVDRLRRLAQQDLGRCVRDDRATKVAREQ